MKMLYALVPAVILLCHCGRGKDTPPVQVEIHRDLFGKIDKVETFYLLNGEKVTHGEVVEVTDTKAEVHNTYIHGIMKGSYTVFTID